MADILYVFAHPDDETFTVGGMIAHHHDLRKSQTLYCATHGEAGKTGNPPVCSKEELSSFRQKELDEAIGILGLNKLILRDFGDGKLKEMPFEKLVADVLTVLEEEKPEIVITFPPEGISGHQDHRIIQQATLAAVKQASFPTTLYYIIIPDSVAEKMGRHVYSTPDSEIDHSVDVTKYREQIVAALLAHRSQHLSVEKAFPEIEKQDWSRFRTHEYFQLGYRK
ncbi:PIG-L deacetylase family protein [Risungbinella massiliensis]|uniref:PIG-L deacetylase family protein n=1 Tax=Risungbinella massiliensis TaxID=1329796 RepID=UPI0005CBE92F|nr:PIG-L deacetylase family protein [Risungbinella massiliensis]